MDKAIVFAAEQPTATVTRRVQRGDLARLAPGVYTTDVTSDPVAVVRREWHTVVGHLLPRAVITDRSAPTSGPVGGYLYLSRDGRGHVRPGCRT